jgi:predicted 3-demethylubiquinone-9 3-methyltransferase (glyoxalase superfamily)
MEKQNNEIYPCIWFDGNAKAAATFYTKIFANSGIQDDTPMVVIFNLGGYKLMGLNGGPIFKVNPSISFFVYCESIQATNALWEKLIDGGSVMMDINAYPWSERYGWLKDKFGITWQISVSAEKQNGYHITPSMLFTGNNFGKAEEAISVYSAIFNNPTTKRLVLYPEGDPNASKVMYSEIRINHFDLILMDGPGAHDFVFNEALSFVISCDTQDEIDYYWDKLTSDGGKESMCGWVKDKFGVSWQIVPKIISKLMTDPEKGGRVMEAVMKMKKLNIQVMMDA